MEADPARSRIVGRPSQGSRGTVVVFMSALAAHDRLAVVCAAPI